MANKEDEVTDGPEEVAREDSPPTADSQPGEDIDQLRGKLKQLEQQRRDAYENWLRCQADFDNFRKRQQRRLEDAERFGNQSLLRDLLEPLDNFERALTAIHGETVDVDALRTGIHLVSTQLLGVLSERWGLKKIVALEQPYDANLHQAVAFVESEGCQSEKVVEEFQTGYLLHDRVIRPAMVKVCKPVSPTPGREARREEGGAQENSTGGEGLERPRPASE